MLSSGHAAELTQFVVIFPYGGDLKQPQHIHAAAGRWCYRLPPSCTRHINFNVPLNKSERFVSRIDNSVYVGAPLRLFKISTPRYFAQGTVSRTSP